MWVPIAQIDGLHDFFNKIKNENCTFSNSCFKVIELGNVGLYEVYIMPKYYNCQKSSNGISTIYF